MKTIDAISHNPKARRNEQLLHIFEKAGEKSSSNFKYKFWLHENHPELLYNKKSTTKNLITFIKIL